MDSDGISDATDQCPRHPEVYDHPDKTPLTADGCPGTRSFTYCELRRERVEFGNDHGLTDPSREVLEAMSWQLRDLGLEDHHLFVWLEPRADGYDKRLEQVRAEVVGHGLPDHVVRTEHVSNACSEVVGDEARKPLPPAPHLRATEPTIWLVRVQSSACPKHSRP
jgi:hypothetical protein